MAHRARVIAGVNVVTALFMTVAGLAVGLLQKLGVPMAALFGIVAVIAAGTAVWTFVALPMRRLHELAVMLLTVVYRLE
ncbi:hypothetical protein J8J40_31390, partial [Mycobacterium tuberculosis]|nr:hypothetical protein [Mycobacterium tuberculosis]